MFSAICLLQTFITLSYMHSSGWKCASCFCFGGKYLIKHLIISKEEIRGNPGKEPEIWEKKLHRKGIMFFWFWRGFSPNPRKVNYILGQTVSFWKVLSLANWLSFLTYEFCRNSHRSVRHGDVIMAKELGKEDPPYSQKSCFGKQ